MTSTSKAALGATLATAAGIFGGTFAQAQEACSSYTVVRGDTLSQIASRAGVQGGFQFLFNANTDVLTSPSLIEVGQVLKIPCKDGSLPGGAATEAAAPAAPVLVPDALDRPLRFVTASGYAPFTDEALTGGGAITMMVNRSMELGGTEQDYRVFFVNDWGAQLTDLLPSGAFDMAFPWFRPDCDALENLSEASAFRCTDFKHTDPFYDTLIGWFTLKGSPYEGATTYDELMGTRICRPEAWFTFDMEAVRMVEPNITYVTGAVEEDCWRMLDAGEVDIVTYDLLPAEDDSKDLGMTDRIVQLEALAGKAQLHGFVSNNNPNADAIIEIVNAGLEELRLSGEWFEIVRSQVRETVEN